MFANPHICCCAISRKGITSRNHVCRLYSMRRVGHGNRGQRGGTAGDTVWFAALVVPPPYRNPGSRLWLREQSHTGDRETLS